LRRIDKNKFIWNRKIFGFEGGDEEYKRAFLD
jgi:hypothetical protein